MNWLSTAPWLVALAGILGGGAFGGIERLNYLEEKAARAQDLDRTQQAVLKAKAGDAAKTRQLEDEHAAEVAKLKEQANARDLAIASVPSTDICAVSPAMRSLFDGLRTRAAAPGHGQPGGPGGARAVVP